MVVTVDALRKSIAASRSSDMLWLLEKDYFADFEIHCGEHIFKVHRAVIIQGCEYFKTLTASSFKEGTERKVVFEEDEPAVIARTIYFLYTGRLSVATPLTDLKIDSFCGIDESKYKNKPSLYCASVYATAVRLSINGLMDLAACDFRCLPSPNVQSIHKHSTKLVRYIYNSTPPTARDLKDIVVRIVQYGIRKELDTMTDTDVKLKLLQEAIHRAPDLGFDLLTMPLLEKALRCSDCQGMNPVLFLRCAHAQKHNYMDQDCLKENLKTQECICCHATDVFDMRKGLGLKTWLKDQRIGA